MEPAYGKAKVTLEDGKLVWHWSNFHWRLEHYQFNQFVANGDGLFDAFEFHVGLDGTIRTVRALGQEFHRAGENEK